MTSKFTGNYDTDRLSGAYKGTGPDGYQSALERYRKSISSPVISDEWARDNETAAIASGSGGLSNPSDQSLGLGDTYASEGNNYAANHAAMLSSPAVTTELYRSTTPGYRSTTPGSVDTKDLFPSANTQVPSQNYGLSDAEWDAQGVASGNELAYANTDWDAIDTTNAFDWDNMTSEDMENLGSGVMGAANLGMALGSYLDNKKTSKAQRKLTGQMITSNQDEMDRSKRVNAAATTAFARRS